MDDGARPVVTDVTDGLSKQLVEAEDIDALASTLLTGLMGPGAFPCVHGASLGLVEGAGRRLRCLGTDGDLGGEHHRPAWSHVDSFEDGPLNRVVRTREPIMGCAVQLEDEFPAFCRDRQLDGTMSIAVLPLEPVLATAEVAEAAGLPDRPLGALALFFECEQAFDTRQRHQLALLGRVVSQALRQLAGGSSPHARVPGDPRSDGAAEAAIQLPNDERAPSQARQFLRERLRQWQVSDDDSATAELCLSELVTNAVIHAGSSSHLLVALIEGMLEVCVRDHGGPPETHELVAPTTDDEDDDELRVHGRGLRLVESLSSDWGTEILPDGTSVWFTLDLGDVG